MAADRPQWLADLSRAFKRHRQGRSGWTVEVMRERLRVVSSELPPRPTDPADAPPMRRAVTLVTPPGPATAAAALAEACALFDAVMAGGWAWPDPDAPPAGDDVTRLSPVTLQRLSTRLQAALVGEKVVLRTWERMYAPFLARLVRVAGTRHWSDDRELLTTTLRHWEPNSRARQMAHDRLRRLWKEAGWPWPESVLTMRGNGKAAAAPDGVRSFTDQEITELRERIQRSKLTPADLVAWDCLICFGLRPAELQGLQLEQRDGMLLATITRAKKSSKGSSGARTVPAVPPPDWPADAHQLLQRWHAHGLPPGMLTVASPGETLSHQLARLRQQQPIRLALDPELTSYGCRHAFALRLAQHVGLHPREAAELMGHSPAVHLSTYGRRLDQPKLLAKVHQILRQDSPPSI